MKKQCIGLATAATNLKKRKKKKHQKPKQIKQTNPPPPKKSNVGEITFQIQIISVMLMKSGNIRLTYAYFVCGI